MRQSMRFILGCVVGSVLSAGVLFVGGCGDSSSPAPSTAAPATPTAPAAPAAEADKAPPMPEMTMDDAKATATDAVKAAADYPLTTCVVSGDKLPTDGSMVVYKYEGHEVHFCCKDCIADFEKDPAKYMAKLNAVKDAVPEAAPAQTPAKSDDDTGM